MGQKVNIIAREEMTFGKKKVKKGGVIAVISLVPGITASEVRNAILHGSTAFKHRRKSLKTPTE